MVGPAQLGEFQLIESFFAPLAGPGGLGLKDDAALIAVPAGHDLVTTVDALIAGVHFLSDDPPATIAWKALAVNISDLAAKGAEPLGFLLTLALPPDWDRGWLAEFADGLGRAAGLWHCPLLGGDTVKMPGPLTLSVTAFGSVPKGTMLRRSEAKPGDILAVTGTIGDAALGLPLAAGWDVPYAVTLESTDQAYLIDRYRRPRPRIALTSALRAQAHAGMDVSDGLLGDAEKLAAVSGLALAIEADRVPLSPAARHVVSAHPSCLERILTGGDDYEILCAIPPEHWTALVDQAASLKIALTPIGTFSAGEGLSIMNNGEPLSFASYAYQHFSQDSA